MYVVTILLPPFPNQRENQLSHDKFRFDPENATRRGRLVACMMDVPSAFPTSATSWDT